MADDNGTDVTYVQARRDPDFLHRVREAYTGRHDALDALWWLSRPLEAGPSGATSPGTELRDLQRRVFSAEGEAARDDEAALRLRQLKKDLAADRLRIEHAIRAVQSPLVAHIESDGPDGAAIAPGEPQSGTPHETLRKQHGHFSPRGRSILTIAVAAAAIVGLVLGFGVGNWFVPAGASWDSFSTSSPSSPAEAPTEVMAIFDRVRKPSDTPTPHTPETLVRGSFRQLMPFGDNTAYAARSTSNEVCLVVFPASDDYVSSCVTPSDFPRGGLRIAWVVHDWSIERYASELGELTDSDWNAVWNSDGSLEMRSTGDADLNTGLQGSDALPAAPFEIPRATSNELAHLLFVPGDDARSVIGSVPEGSEAVTIEIACDAMDTSVVLTYELASAAEAASPILVSSSLPCDKSHRIDVIELPNALAGEYQLSWSGDFAAVTSAYAILSTTSSPG